MSTELKPGDKVTYTASHGAKEKGIVKSLNDSLSIAWVVYQCNGEWSKYFNYTGASTNIENLTPGWE